MGTESTSPTHYTWLYFALMTVACWGTYGILLHTGITHMARGGGDPWAVRFKAYLFVGLAYFLTAVLVPLFLLMLKGDAWTNYPGKGMSWSLIAGVAGAMGAFGVLLAFGFRGTPPVVMSIVFAGAPIVNAVISLILHPPAGGWRGLNWKFVVGILLAALGATLVTKFKPAPAPAKSPAQAAASAGEGGSTAQPGATSAGH